MMSGFITCSTEQERKREQVFYRLGSKELKDATPSSELVHFRLPLKIVCVCFPASARFGIFSLFFLLFVSFFIYLFLLLDNQTN